MPDRPTLRLIRVNPPVLECSACGMAFAPEGDSLQEVLKDFRVHIVDEHSDNSHTDPQEESMVEKRRYTQEEADVICSEFHGYLSADKIRLVVPAMQELVDALPKVMHKGMHVNMDTISDDNLQRLKVINMGARIAPKV
jgi:predicted small metal-binding protein